MQAIKAHFDGKSIKIPKELRIARAGEVLVIFQETTAALEETSAWLRAQETTFTKVWDNNEDAVYDSL